MQSHRSRLILIEGLPGSGKTSLAAWLCDRLTVPGVAARWVEEMQRDHPVIDRATRRSAGRPGFAERCIEGWRAFSASLRAGETCEVVILEGCLFQSTVRFMVEQDRPDGEIAAYLPAVERWLGPLSPRLVYLTQTDAERYLRNELVRRKGDETVARITKYSEGTPFCVRRGLRGPEALVALYTAYRHVCDRLVGRSGLPTLELDTMRLDEADVRRRVEAGIARALVG